MADDPGRKILIVVSQSLPAQPGRERFGPSRRGCSARRASCRPR
jgi:hypothetical protein